MGALRRALVGARRLWGVVTRGLVGAGTSNPRCSAPRIGRLFFRSLRGPSRVVPDPNSAPARTASEAAEAATLVELLRDAEVLPPSEPMLLLQGPPDAASAHEDGAFTQAMRELRAQADDLQAQRMSELAYLTNVLAAGCALDGRSMRPLEAAHAAVATCNLGIEYLMQDESAHATAASVLRNESVDKLFRVGWRLLAQDVQLPAARALDTLLARQASREIDGERTRRLEQASRTLHAAIAAGKTWTAVGRLTALQVDIDAATLATLLALMGECPTLRGELAVHARAKLEDAKQEIQFVSTGQQLRSVQAFVAHAIHDD